MSEVRRGVVAYVALGSNRGEREALLRRALELLCEGPGTELLGSSKIYETDPVGPSPQDDYLNAVVRVRCTLSARELLARLQAIERCCGRDRSESAVRWGPRTLDLDLLLFGDQSIDEVGLSVPHPRLHERPFVLVPLCEVAADEIHPTLRVPIRELAARVGKQGVRSFSGRLLG